MIDTVSSNNKRIAKNAMMLYIRFIFRMLAVFCTARVVLQTLGEVDYGIYNIVAGVVALFEFFYNTLLNAMQRFLSYELGRGNLDQVRRVFSLGIVTHIIVIVAIVILAETVGLWFLNTYLNIPQERLLAANWVYQFSILAISFRVLCIPFDASIISFEKMSFYAYISIIDILMQVLIILVLLNSHLDNLILYSSLVMLSNFILTSIYIVYCRISMPVLRFKLELKLENNLGLLKNMSTFIGWNLLGSSIYVFYNQSINITLNIFFGVLVNAAVAVASQVSSGIYNFASNFQTAFKPQIVKYYALGEFDDLYDLILKSSKYSLFLLLVVAVPVLVNMKFILSIWLLEVPFYATAFSALLVICILFEVLSTPLYVAVQATGKIKYYHVVMSVIQIIGICVIYYVASLVNTPVILYKILLVFAVIQFLVKVLYLKLAIRISLKKYFYEVVFVNLKVLFVGLIIPIIYKFSRDSYIDSIVNILVCLASVLASVYFVGFKRGERRFILDHVKKCLVFR